ncbi:MAG: hypothetical protein JWR32_3500 [Mycobacterium sp.]|jgi:hypothetical protein|nr:hypothetical protein [Mycobacterium sp.]
MTIIELNIAGYQVTHNSPNFRDMKKSWLAGWRGLQRKGRGREQSAGCRAA